MAISIVQKNSAATTTGGATSLGCTLGATPTSGNWLVAFVNSDSVLNTPSGWTLVKSDVNAVGLYVFKKQAGSSESPTFTVASSGGTNASIEAATFELAGADGTTDISLNAHSTGTSLTVGPSSTTTTASEAVFAVFGAQVISTPTARPTSFTTQYEIGGLGPTAPGDSTSLYLYSLGLSATQTVTAAITWPTSYSASGILVSFKAVSVVAAPVNTVAPAITGTVTTGSTLTCSTGTWSNTPTGYTYQWKTVSGGNISGATSSTFVLTSAQDGQAVYCAVTASNAGGSNTANSNQVTPPGPTIVRWWGGEWIAINRRRFVDGAWVEI